MKYTHGHWAWIVNNYPETPLENKDGQQVLSIYESWGGGNLPSIADASLIAAAPDLLEALENCASTLLMLFEDDQYANDHPWIGESYSLAIKAISKAREER